MSFESAFEKTVKSEGGLSLDPDDAGNWTGGRIGVGELRGTKYGISAASYPDEDIRNLSPERASVIYRRDFWDPLRLDDVLDAQVQEEIFDTAVNTSAPGRPFTAGKIVQRAINYLEVGDPLAVDGVVGANTIAFVNKWCRKDPEALFKCLNGFQFIHYVEVATGTREKFAWGWMKRIQYYQESKRGMS